VISGFFIIGLTLYSSAVDRIRDYGTLKAIGATNGYITRLILLQSSCSQVIYNRNDTVKDSAGVSMCLVFSYSIIECAALS
jgi:putative ABC transport system permease protein